MLREEGHCHLQTATGQSSKQGKSGRSVRSSRGVRELSTTVRQLWLWWFGVTQREFPGNRAQAGRENEFGAEDQNVFEEKGTVGSGELSNTRCV